MQSLPKSTAHSSAAARVLAPLAFLLATGCLYQGQAESIGSKELAAPHRDHVDEFPVLRQEGEKDCGAAALAATLRYWGVELEPKDVREALGAPSDTPLRAGDLRDYARRLGFDAFLVRGEPEDLRRELRAQRPVIVGMLKPYVGDQWFAHYEVVTAVGADDVITMDPGSGWRRYPLPGFDAEWRRTKHLTLIIAPR